VSVDSSRRRHWLGSLLVSAQIYLRCTSGAGLVAVPAVVARDREEGVLQHTAGRYGDWSGLVRAVRSM
jgi:hypothetical protein